MDQDLPLGKGGVSGLEGEAGSTECTVQKYYELQTARKANRRKCRALEWVIASELKCA